MAYNVKISIPTHVPMLKRSSVKCPFDEELSSEFHEFSESKGSVKILKDFDLGKPFDSSKPNDPVQGFTLKVGLSGFYLEHEATQQCYTVPDAFIRWLVPHGDQLSTVPMQVVKIALSGAQDINTAVHNNHVGYLPVDTINLLVATPINREETPLRYPEVEHTGNEVILLDGSNCPEDYLVEVVEWRKGQNYSIKLHFKLPNNQGWLGLHYDNQRNREEELGEILQRLASGDITKKFIQTTESIRNSTQIVRASNQEAFSSLFAGDDAVPEVRDVYLQCERTLEFMRSHPEAVHLVLHKRLRIKEIRKLNRNNKLQSKSLMISNSYKKYEEFSESLKDFFVQELYWNMQFSGMYLDQGRSPFQCIAFASGEGPLTPEVAQNPVLVLMEMAYHRDQGKTLNISERSLTLSERQSGDIGVDFFRWATRHAAYDQPAPLNLSILMYQVNQELTGTVPERIAQLKQWVAIQLSQLYFPIIQCRIKGELHEFLYTEKDILEQSDITVAQIAKANATPVAQQTVVQQYLLAKIAELQD